jgi:hypothetical protein
MKLGECTDFLQPFIWRCDLTMDLTKEQHHILYNLGKSVMETLAMIGQAGEEQCQEHAHNFL